MFLVGILSWWYGDGWRQRFSLLKERFATSTDYFSIGLLIKTLFAPFRQISAGSVGGPMAVQLRALVDQLISRLIGAIVRFCLMIIGIIVILLQLVWGLIIVLSWLVIPLLPIVGIIIAILGVNIVW